MGAEAKWPKHCFAREKSIKIPESPAPSLGNLKTLIMYLLVFEGNTNKMIDRVHVHGFKTKFNSPDDNHQLSEQVSFPSKIRKWARAS